MVHRRAGFKLPEAKSTRRTGVDRDTLYVFDRLRSKARSPSPATRASSKEWKRGTPLAEAKTRGLRGQSGRRDSAGVSVSRDDTPGWVYEFVATLAVTFFTTETLRAAARTTSSCPAREARRRTEVDTFGDWLTVELQPKLDWSVERQGLTRAARLLADEASTAGSMASATSTVLFEPTRAHLTRQHRSDEEFPHTSTNSTT